MRFEINLVCCVLVFGGSPQTGGQSHALPPAFTSAPSPAPAETPQPPEVTEPHVNEFPQRTQYPAGNNETSTDLTATATTQRTVGSGTSADSGHYPISSSTKATPQCMTAPAVTTPSLSASAAADNLSPTPTVVSSTLQQSTVHSDLPASEVLSTFSSRTVPAVPAAASTSLTSTVQPPSAVTTRTAVLAQTLASGWAPVGPTHQEFPSELNIVDNDLKGSRQVSPLDPLLAGLLSVFIVSTAVVFTVLFIKFRQRVNRPEFHRLQDLPMDDLMEDTPLSRYAH